MGATMSMATATPSSSSSSTLLIGAGERPCVDVIELEAHVILATMGGARYSEIVLYTALEELQDAWATLRSLKLLVEPHGVLTVRYGDASNRAFRKRDVSAILLLAGYEVCHWDHSLPDRGSTIRANPVQRMAKPMSCTVVVPCKDEVGNVDDLVRRLPELGTHTELIFVDGDSSDGTPDQVSRVASMYPLRDIKLLHQNAGFGKSAAVFQGFDAATGEILMILDADMTVAPEDLPRFYHASREGITEVANGTRFAYPMQSGAMPTLNIIGNRVFAWLLSWITGTPVDDTLCGTKALTRQGWRQISAVRSEFGGHDLWGDFDLLFSAARCGLRVADVPIRYHARATGTSKMRPWLHGMTLARTCLAGLVALKLPGKRTA